MTFFQIVLWSLGRADLDAFLVMGSVLLSLAGYMILIPRFNASGAALVFLSLKIIAIAYQIISCSIIFRKKSSGITK